MEILKFCMEVEDGKEVIQPIINGMMSNKAIECEFRYKFLRSLCNNTRYKDCFVIDSHLAFVKCTSIYTRYRILASQYLFQHSSTSIDASHLLDVKEVEQICQSFALDSTLDYDLRADSADLLIRLGPSPESKEIGRAVITMLGRSVGGKSTIYTNRQNVHEETISASVEAFIKYLMTLQLPVVATFNDIQKEIEEYYLSHSEFNSIKTINENNKQSSNIDRIKSSLFRMAIDQTLYLGSQNIHSIFLKIWVMISTSTQSDLLKKRLIEELIDMADTCASGHLSRLINVFSGIQVIDNKEFNINIGLKKQVETNLVARLNKMIKDLPDEKDREELLNEMASSVEMIEKPKLKMFFRTKLNDIRDELYKEFVGGKYLTDDTFEMYMREAISFFEQGR
jgi:hypothetical protein